MHPLFDLFRQRYSTRSRGTMKLTSKVGSKKGTIGTVTIKGVRNNNGLYLRPLVQLGLEFFVFSVNTPKGPS